MKTVSDVFTLQSLFTADQSLLGLPIYADSGLIQRLFGRAGDNNLTVYEKKRKTNA